MLRKVNAIGLAILCSSCAAVHLRREAARAGASAERSVVCATGAGCDQLWRDARFWIGEHSARGGRLQTREALSTGCSGEAPAPCLELVRVPLDAQHEEIHITVECSSGGSACVPDAAATKRELIDYLIGFPPVED